MDRTGFRPRAVPAAVASFAIGYFGAVGVGVSPPVATAGAAGLSVLTWLAVSAARRVFWNATARAAAMLLCSATTGASGVLTLLSVPGTVGRLAGWCAIAASTGCGVAFLLLAAERRR
jgi:hypothetical protein